jgi:hypothetical protein
MMKFPYRRFREWAENNTKAFVAFGDRSKIKAAKAGLSKTIRRKADSAGDRLSFRNATQIAGGSPIHLSVILQSMAVCR